MSELIDQLRNLRAAAYRKLTQNSDFKVLMELDQMLGRLDPADTPMAPPASPGAVAGSEDEAGSEEDTEAAPPEPLAEPPPAPEPAQPVHEDAPGEEVLLADEALVDADAPEAMLMASPDVLAAETGASAATGEDEPPPALAETAEGAGAETYETAVSADTTGTVIEPAEPVTDETAYGGQIDEALLAEALAAETEPDVFAGEDSAVAAVAQALSHAEPSQADETSQVADRSGYSEAEPAPAADTLDEPAPVDLAPEEDYDTAAPAGAEETSDDAYESALNRLNALIERASHRLKREDGSEPNGASYG